MSVNYFPAEFEIIRNYDKCIGCRACERQCANEVHYYDSDYSKMLAHENKCVDCQRCVCLCPTGALKIQPNANAFRQSANYTQQLMLENYRQAESGGVLLSSMGTPKDYPVYWDKILLNASQVTNPPIHPLREPMETKVRVRYRIDGELVTVSELPKQRQSMIAGRIKSIANMHQEITTDQDGSINDYENFSIRVLHKKI